jgi:hypothetical protein
MLDTLFLEQGTHLFLRSLKNSEEDKCKLFF